nr:ABC transporter substrate-binding protein [Tepidiphilus sp.]
MKKKSLVMGLVLALGCSLALAQVKVGVTVSATGPAASLGVPEKNTVDLLPREIAGQKIEYLVLDDASDTTNAVNNTRKLIAENQVDVVMGSTVSPNALAMIDVVAEARVPMIAFAASEKIVSPVDDKRRWVFKTAQNDRMMAEAIVEHMAANGVKTVGFIGFSDAYGEGWFENFKAALDAAGLSLVVNERYNRTDTSVTGQVLKIVGAKPDAVLIAGSGTPAALPQKTLKERGYAGKIYQTHGVVNPDFLRVCGRDCEGTFLPSSPVVVAPQLPDSHPAKAAGVEYFQLYESKYGKGSVTQFGSYVWDAGKLLAAALP